MRWRSPALEYLTLSALAACGRVGFVSDAGVDSGQADSRAVDAAMDASGDAVWTVVQTSGDFGQSAVVAPTGDGHLLVVALETLDDTATVVDNAPAGSSTFSLIAGGQCASHADSSGIQLWYTADAHAGATSIAATGAVGAVVAWEVAWPGQAMVETVGALDDETASTLMTGPMLTVAQPHSFVIATVRAQAFTLGLVAGSEYVMDTGPAGDGFAHLSPTATTAPIALWDQTVAAGYCTVSVAFAAAP
ncbi:MAG TPA: hypothetical protein VGM90_12890 [Kofleriaceae bacterium]|jgi:hypothetical protein